MRKVLTNILITAVILSNSGVASVVYAGSEYNEGKIEKNIEVVKDNFVTEEKDVSESEIGNDFFESKLISTTTTFDKTPDISEEGDKEKESDKDSDNTRPVITLIGGNINIVQGETFLDPGATAFDKEDGDITKDIVASGYVYTNIPGDYFLYYDVKDSKGLKAERVKRLVRVKPEPVELKTAVVSAQKIVCKYEEDLPNWGLGGPDISSTTASTYVKNNPNCKIVPWIFEWAFDGPDSNNPGDNVGVAGSVWTPFQSTTSVLATSTKVWVREQFNDNYINFAGVNNSSDYSAEFYCDTDVLNYDNYDWLIPSNPGKTYHCVAWNVLKKDIPLNTPPVITLIGANPININVGEVFTDPGATALDLEDGDITEDLVILSNVDINVPGVYEITYNVVDSGGLHAVEVKRTVNVNPRPTSGCFAVFSEDDIQVTLGDSWDGLNFNLENVLFDNGYNIDVHNSQTGIQVWTPTKDKTLIKITPVFSKTAYNEVFGYFKNNQFYPVYKNSEVEGFSTTPLWSEGEVEVLIEGKDPIVFAIYAKNIDKYRYTQDSLNESNERFAVVYNVGSTEESYIVAFEDLSAILPSTSDKDYNDMVARVDVVNCKNNIPINTPPVITLIGANPININVGEVFTDPGATALDLEDGDITEDLVILSNVDINVPGVYEITYNVVDSGGLHAVEVKRTVNVLEIVPENKGKITFCLVLADTDNSIATSSYSLPQGAFSISLASTTDTATTTIENKVWTSELFSPNRPTILSQNDSDCVTYDNLPYGRYHYSELAINGSSWNTALYNDQATQPVNNIFDLFSYGMTNVNSDGYIVLHQDRSERTLVVLSKYNKDNQCYLPVIDSPLTASVVSGSVFNYVLTASSTEDVLLSVSTSTLPSWLSYATTTNTLSGTPTEAGVYEVSLLAENICGFDAKTLIITVTSGGGGSPTSDISVSKTADKSTASVGDTVTYTIVVSNAGPSDATLVSLTDVLPGTLTFVSSTSTLGSYSTTTGVWIIGDLSNNSSTTLTLVVTVNPGTESQTIVNTATVTGTQTDPDTTNNTSSSTLNVNPAPVPPCTSNCGGGGGGGGGNGPIFGSFLSSGGPIIPPPAPEVPSSCYYLFDYLRKDFNNNPVEVIKLQVFLRDLEGHSGLQITGVYDDQTIAALNEFQNKYKDDILTPWGHTAPTSYVYILTKKKVNEIYCKTAFPVNEQQQEEIDNYRRFLQGLRDSGIEFSDNNLPIQNPSDFIINGQVGSISTPTNPNVAQRPQDSENVVAVSDESSTTTQGFISNLTANVISSGRALANTLLGLFVFPFGSKSETDLQCQVPLGLGWLNILLLVVIAVISYLWYREYSNNKKIEEINKTIDLE